MPTAFPPYNFNKCYKDKRLLTNINDIRLYIYSIYTPAVGDAINTVEKLTHFEGHAPFLRVLRKEACTGVIH